MNVEIDIVVCTLADYDEDGHLQISTDSPGIDGTEGTQPAEALFPHGIIGRPLDPDKGAESAVGLGAPGLLIRVGDLRYVIPLNDPRDVIDKKIPKLKKGGKMVAGGAGEYRSFFNIDGEDPTGAKKPGSVSIMVPYAKSGAKKSLGLSFNVRDSGAEDISLVHGDGARVTIDKNGTTITSPNAEHYIENGVEGNVLAGATKVQGSMSVGDPGAAQAVVSAPPLVQLLTQLLTMLATTPAVAPGAPLMPAAAGLAAALPKLLTQHLKAT